MRKFISSVAIMACCMTNVFASEQPVRLSLADAIRMAAEKNLDVRAELYNPAQFEADIRRNYSIYDPLLTMDTNYTNSTTQVANSFLTGSSKSEVNTLNANAGIAYSYWTGGNIALNFNNAYTETNSSRSLSNYWQSSLGVTLSQPLLKNFGQENTEVNIRVSRLSKFASLERFNSKLLDVVAQTRNEYFKLYNLREQLEVKKVSLALARKILAETKARVAAGVLPAMEILNAEFGAVSREKDLIDAEKAVIDQVDVLRLLLQLEGAGDIVTSDLPRKDSYQVSESESLKHALNRPDIKEQKRSLEIAELQTRVFNNRIKPDLALIAGASLTGLDRSYSRNLEKVGSFDSPVWNIGLNLSYPLGNNAAENDYRKSRLKTEQTALQIRSLEESVANDVKNAIRTIGSSYKQIEVTERGRAFAEERLRAFVRKNEVGLATTKDVLDVENDLATAKSNQITAVVSYANAVTRLWQVTGELLEREGIRVVEGDADKLYTNIR